MHFGPLGISHPSPKEEGKPYILKTLFERRPARGFKNLLKKEGLKDEKNKLQGATIP
jgi:hypothetical protein